MEMHPDPHSKTYDALNLKIVGHLNAELLHLDAPRSSLAQHLAARQFH